MPKRRAGLAARRKVVGFSQDELAERVRVDRSTIARWESGYSAPQPSKRVEVAKALRVSVDQLDELLTEESLEVDNEGQVSAQAIIGARLISIRKEYGWTARKLAEKLRAAAENPREIPYVDSLVRMVRIWEKGTRCPSETYRLLYCKVFGMSEEELFFPPAPARIPHADEVVDARAGSAIRGNPEEIKASGGLVVGQALSGPEDISVSALIEASAADAAQITMSAGREEINPLTIEQYYEEVCRLSVDYIGSTVEANRQILQRATDLRRALERPISVSYRRPAQSADIYFMIGLLSGICAYSCLDLNHPNQAMTQARTSFMMGDLIGHDGLRAWALGTRSLIARFQERYPEALGYAREGIQYATSGTALVRLRCGEGQTLAHMGNATDSIKFLNLAKEAREHVSSPDIASGLFVFSEAKQTYYTGSSLQWLPGVKNAESAQAESTRAIQMFESPAAEVQSPGDVLLARIYLANSRLTLGEIEGSIEALRPVLDLPPSSRSSWQKKRMRQIMVKLDEARFSGSRLAISACDEISSFVRSS